MKVLWIASGLPSFVREKFHFKPQYAPGWVESLLIELINNNEVSFAFICPVENGSLQKIEFNGILYFTIPVKKRGNLKIMSRKLISNYLQTINDFKPDLIHIHGTENNFGSLKYVIGDRIPIVISIQGFIFSYLPYLIQSVCNTNIAKYKSLKNLMISGGLNGYLTRWKNYEIIEKEIINVNKYFIGRTLWDQAQLLAINPNANYFHGEELLRDDFYINHWEIDKCNRETIFFSSAAYSIKGFHTLLNALIILKKKYPKIVVKTPLFNKNKRGKLFNLIFGEDYQNLILSFIKKNKLETNVIFYDKLTSSEMAQHYANSHVFVSSSFIENSPNSTCEAMLIGTPIITSFVGGVGSLVTDEESALFFQSGDSNSLAFQIDRIFSNDELALKISVNSKELAFSRHNKKNTALQYLEIYQNIIDRQ